MTTKKEQFSIVIFILYATLANAALQCGGPCPYCTGTCHNTPEGEICQCGADKTGDNCDLCLVRPGWFDGGNGYQYAKTTNASTYIEAEKQCNNFGGHLAYHGIRDKRVYENITSLFSEVYIGLVNKLASGTFVWLDGESSGQTWTPWKSGFPVSNSDNNCGFETSSGGFAIENYLCSNIEFGLCEVPIGFPAAIQKFNPKNNCEYSIIPHSFRDVAERLCHQQGGELAVDALSAVNGNVLKKVLMYFDNLGYDLESGVYVGFKKNISTSDFLSDGVNLTIPNSAANWKPGSPGASVEDYLAVHITPEWLDYAWIEDANSSLLLPGLCEFCDDDKRTNLDQRTCKSGKRCPENSICLVNEGSCFEACICADGYAAAEGNKDNCVPDGCIGRDCGNNSYCFVTESGSGECRCRRGFVPIGTDAEGCSDPCDGITCATSASCLISYETGDPTGICVCNQNYTQNVTVDNGCIPNECRDGGSITCGENTVCGVTNPATTELGCACQVGFGLVSPGSNACTTCPQTSYTFPRRSISDYLTVAYDPPQLAQASLCMVITPPAGEGLRGAIFSYATATDSNLFLVFFDSVTTHSTYFDYPNSPLKRITIEVTKETHLCYLFSKSDKTLELYVNGTLYATRVYDNSNPIPDENGSLLIGQEQDSVGSGFTTSQAFFGKVENLMLWERLLTSTEVADMAADKCVCSADFDMALTADIVTVHGQVVAEYPAC